MNNKPINEMVNGDVRGWIALSANEQASQQQQMLEIASLYRDTFKTEPGRRVLAILLQTTVMQPTVTPASTQFEAGIREGRADLVRGILRQIEIAETGGQETLNPWQTLTPPKVEPTPRKTRRTSSTRQS